MLSRFGLSPRVVLVVTTSFTAAAAVAWVGLDRGDTPAPVQTVPAIASQVSATPTAAMTPVLAAVSTIEVGSQIMPEAITQVVMGKPSHLDVFLADTPTNRQALPTLVAPRTIPAGTPFVRSDLVAVPVVAKRDAVISDTAALLSPGMRGISVPVTAEMAVAGLITRGDRVDVLLSYDAPSDMHAVRTVLRNVRVIATDQTTKVSNEAPSSPPKTVTLELHPEGVKVLTLAKRTGNLVLVLSPRGAGDRPVIADDAPVLSSQFSGFTTPVATASEKSVRIIRGGTSSATVMVPVGSIGRASGQAQLRSNSLHAIAANPSK